MQASFGHLAWLEIKMNFSGNRKEEGGGKKEEKERERKKEESRKEQGRVSKPQRTPTWRVLAW